VCDLGRWQPNFVLNLVYPEGFAAEDDGGLKFIPGSHLWRDPGGLRAQTDEDLESGWLQGKLHPVTQQPLQIVVWSHTKSVIAFPANLTKRPILP
jgi:hypothetical protein